jgi:hypothetical protein
MTDLRDAARQALKSLRGYRREINCEQPCDAERALEAALEQPEQEPVAWMTPGKDIITCNGAGTRFNDWTPLFTHPPRREWRGLTEEEVINLSDLRGGCYGTTDFARAIEAALKEKNHE